MDTRALAAIPQSGRALPLPRRYLPVGAGGACMPSPSECLCVLWSQTLAAGTRGPASARQAL